MLPNFSNYYDAMNYRRRSNTFQFEGDPFAKTDDGIDEICHEIKLLMKNLQTKPQIRSISINCFYLYYTVIKNRN